MIGNKARLGSKFGRIHSKDSVGPLEATTWSYHDGVEWIETTDDLIILTGIVDIQIIISHCKNLSRGRNNRSSFLTKKS